MKQSTTIRDRIDAQSIGVYLKLQIGITLLCLEHTRRLAPRRREVQGRLYLAEALRYASHDISPDEGGDGEAAPKASE